MAVSFCEEFIYDRLLNFAGVYAITGKGIFPVKAPQDSAKPCLSYRKVSARHIESMTGSSALVFTRMQIDCWAFAYSEVKNLAEQVRLALQGFKGGIGVRIDGINYIGEQDFYEDDTEMFQVSMEFLVHHNEEQP